MRTKPVLLRIRSARLCLCILQSLFLTTVAAYLEAASEGNTLFFSFFLPSEQATEAISEFGDGTGTVCSGLICTHWPGHRRETATSSLFPSLPPSLRLFLPYLAPVYHIPAFDQCQGRARRRSRGVWMCVCECATEIVGHVIVCTAR